MIIRLALALIFLATTANGQGCNTPYLLPYPDLPCNGNGDCIKGTCQCYEGFSGISEWFSSDQGCFTHVAARRATLSMMALIGFFAFSASCWRLLTLRPLRLCTPTKFGSANILEWWVLSSVLLHFGDIVCAAILLFNDTAIHQNLFSLIFAVPSEWIITINCSVLSYLFAHICLNTISINRKEQRILQIMKVELIVTAIIMCSVVAIAEIGSYAATEFDLKLGFGRLHAYTIAAVCFNFFMVIMVFTTLLMRELKTHVSQADELVVTSSNINTAMRRLRLLQLFGCGWLSMATVIGLIAGSLPALMAYFRPLLGVTIPFAHILIVLFLQPRLAHS